MRIGFPRTAGLFWQYKNPFKHKNKKIN